MYNIKNETKYYIYDCREERYISVHNSIEDLLASISYIKKKLSDRMYNLADGTLVQRDWYSSFLLYCYNYKTETIDKDKCFLKFEDCYNKEKALIEWIKANKIKILNSGIKVA